MAGGTSGSRDRGDRGGASQGLARLGEKAATVHICLPRVVGGLKRLQNFDRDPFGRFHRGFHAAIAGSGMFAAEKQIAMGLCHHR